MHNSIHCVVYITLNLCHINNFNVTQRMFRLKYFAIPDSADYVVVDSDHGAVDCLFSVLNVTRSQFDLSQIN